MRGTPEQQHERNNEACVLQAVLSFSEPPRETSLPVNAPVAQTAVRSDVCAPVVRFCDTEAIKTRELCCGGIQD